MDKSMYKISTLIVVLCMLLAGCHSEPVDEIGYGTIEKGVYTNEYFDMSIKVPENWSVQSQAALKNFSESGADLLSGDDENLKAIIEESQKQTVNLFSFFKHELGAPVSFNPNITAVAERLSNTPGIKNGADYLFHVNNFLKSGQIQYDFPEEIYSSDISGVSFGVMPAQLIVKGLTVRQEYYAARLNDYALVFVLSYSTDSEKEELNEVFKNLQFSN